MPHFCGKTSRRQHVAKGPRAEFPSMTFQYFKWMKPWIKIWKKVHLEEAKPSYRAWLQSNIILTKFCLSICKYLATVARCQIFRPRLPNLFNECALYTAQGVIEIKKSAKVWKISSTSHFLKNFHKHFHLRMLIMKKNQAIFTVFWFHEFFLLHFFWFFLDLFRSLGPLWPLLISRDFFLF